ncbi:hypothetical protein M514_04410 [Trichuris suis]|uniref:Uncharacterized protein n=1 Tax=Trichuris suis TaxID=68888 RepID=A0A085MZ66_9BILA|nr:hypothetical protein M514_04410 [Trichuris suis]
MYSPSPLPTGQLFYPWSVEMWGFGGEVTKPFLEVFVIIEGNVAQIDSERMEKVIIGWSEARRITRMRKHLPSEFLDG